MLDIKSEDKGLLIPRMSILKRDAIVTPATGLLVYVNDDDSFYFYDGTGWKLIGIATLISDANNDTKIQVEESADEDIIRFDIAGTERMTINTDGKVAAGWSPI